ncbi:hypothetical protein CYMTET_8375 [Cymbomonas tetramitiformis]|uniref:Sulfotransferase n=1 Tax=Cymbomonas tetramitiformis TaxID=36881 RepID=A0AAE0GTM5_9CHLO|nr:hypothetical protein CYMTET_8375 [Cymbomonas tetramitiformis]
MVRDPVERLLSGFKYFKRYHKKFGDHPAGFHTFATTSMNAFNDCLSRRELNTQPYDALVATDFCFYAVQKGRWAPATRLMIGYYGSILSWYLRCFSRENFHIIHIEDYMKNPRQVLEDTFKFLEIGAIASESDWKQLLGDSKIRNKNSNAGSGYVMNAKTRENLKIFYKSSNERAAKLASDLAFLY